MYENLNSVRYIRQNVVLEEPEDCVRHVDEQIRVIVRGERDLFRDGVVKILDAAPDIRVVGQASTGPEAVALSSREHPDAVLVDAEAAGSDLIDLLQQLLALKPPLSVAVLHSDDDVRVLSQAMGVGVQALVSKESTGDELISAIRNAAKSQDRVLLSVPRRVMERLSDPDGGVLTDRETEVLELVAHGLRNAEIAKSLYISEGTVKRHLTNVYLKLDVGSRMSAVNKAVALRLLLPRRQVPATG